MFEFPWICLLTRRPVNHREVTAMFCSTELCSQGVKVNGELEIFYREQLYQRSDLKPDDNIDVLLILHLSLPALQPMGRVVLRPIEQC